MMTVRVVRAVSIPIVRRVRVAMMTDQQLAVVSVIVRNAQVVRVVMMTALRVVVVRLLVVLQVVAVSLIAMTVQVVRVVMMIVQVVRAALTIVQHVLKLTRNVVPIKFVHAQVVVATIVMRHHAMITKLSVGKTKAQREHHVVERVAVTTMLQSVWNETKSVLQLRPLRT
jgi:hypothetical protein